MNQKMKSVTSKIEPLKSVEIKSSPKEFSFGKNDENDP